MGAVSKITDKLMGLADLIMPIPEEDEIDYAEEAEEEAKAAKQQQKSAKASRRSVSASTSYAEEYRVANGDSIRVERSSYAQEPAFRQKKKQPQLTVHTTKQSQLKMQIFAPKNFDQVTAIADDLKAGKACVVNYEQIEALEQRRICDFVNGVCYVLDGSAKRISNQIMLYVPNGVDVAEAMTLALKD